MSSNIVLKRGLNIPIKGAADRKVLRKVEPGLVAVNPTVFKGLVPRLLVREGDPVAAGSPVLMDKDRPGILLTSPVSGTVKEIVRGEKRRLLAVLIESDGKGTAVDFGACNPAALSHEEAAALLLKSGLWGGIISRPYGVVADPEAAPKAIFISAFSTAPLAPDTEFTLGDDAEAVQAGVRLLSRLTDGGVHLCLNAATYSASPFHKIEGAIVHTVSGPHPAGNVGVQISHISPIRRGETVWTVPVQIVAAMGRLVLSGKLSLMRKIALTGPAAEEPAYIEALPGTPVADLVKPEGDVRIIDGDVLSGTILGTYGFTGLFTDQITLIREGREKEYFGWAKPFRPKLFSSSPCYFSWLTPRKKYDMDTNLHGGPRAFVETKCFSDVTPMDIFPIYLIKACLAGEIEKMEKFGIYEVLPEDLALCDYVDPSKNDIQAIIASGIDLMIKEMA